MIRVLMVLVLLPLPALAQPSYTTRDMSGRTTGQVVPVPGTNGGTYAVRDREGRTTGYLVQTPSGGYQSRATDGRAASTATSGGRR